MSTLPMTNDEKMIEQIKLRRGPKCLLATPAPAQAHKAESGTPSISGQSSRPVASRQQPDRKTAGPNQSTKRTIFGTTPVKNQNALPRLLGVAGSSMCSPTSSSQKDAAHRDSVTFQQAALSSTGGPLSTATFLNCSEVIATHPQFSRARPPASVAEEPAIEPWNSTLAVGQHIEDCVGQILAAVQRTVAS